MTPARRVHRTSWLLCLPIAALPVALHAAAGPPMVTDDPGTSWLLPVQVQTTINGVDINVEAGRVHELDSKDWIYGVALRGTGG
jgi:hypothetical protein